MNTNAKPFYVGSIVVACIVAIGLVRTFDSHPKAQAHQEQLQDLLVRVSKDINKNLPMMIDQDTRFDIAMVLPAGVVLYQYTLVNLSASEVTQQDLDTIRPTILANYKNGASMKAFRERKVEMRFLYHDKNGIEVGLLKVGPSDL